MSHEIRTPMNAIIGMTSIGLKEESAERKNFALRRIESASSHLLNIINDILDISKIESGKMELAPAAFNFREMLAKVTALISQSVNDKRQKFTVQIAQDIPDNLFGDDQRLNQVITNILSNASKFTPEEGEIELVAALQNIDEDFCTLKVSVQDNGIGISAKQQEKLFNIFQQAEAGTARKFGGSGLGLAISRRIVEMMDGEIGVESELGVGTCFYFTVRLRRQKATGRQANEETPGYEMQKVQACDFSAYTALAVDDIEINLEIIVALLEQTKINIDTALSGKTAVEMFRQNPGKYSLILMDMQMPEVDGLQATEMIRASGLVNAKDIPIIAMTANVFKEDIEKCMDAGMNGHLGKPINIAEVISVLQQYLRT